MRAIELRIGTAVAGLVLVAGMAGCTNSDALNPAVSTIQVSVNVQDNSTRFDFGQFTIRQIEIVPIDPQAQAAIGDGPVGLFITSPEVTFETTGVQFAIDRPLATGTYRVDRIRIGNIQIDDVDPPASSATCEDFITFYPPDLAGSPELTDFGGDFLFTVDSQGSATLDITIDVQAFIAAYQSAFFCSSQGQNGCPVAWCLEFFNPFTFTDQSPSFLDLQ